METNERAKEGLLLTLRRFHISEDYGFLLPNPLELPPFYRPWMEIANNLPSLIESHQLRAQVDKMPLLSSRYLKGHREVSLARLILSFITMGYVWQEGETGIAKVLPRNLAIPYGEISRVLGLPPILVHADLILVNWKKRNPCGALEIENLEPIVCLPGGSSTRGFILVTFLVEKAAVPGIKAMVQAVNAIHQLDNGSMEEALHELANSLRDMTRALKKMHDYVDPSVFYGVTRTFFSGWKDNPSLPEGLIYEGFCDQPLAYSGGSAAQSTTLHAFDELLGVQHCRESAAFLHSMRDYMPRPHRAFIEELRRAPPLRRHVSRSGSERLRLAYNKCVAALSDLRTYHIAMVTKYVIIAGRNAKDKPALSSINPLSCLEGRGTGGSGLLSFLKSVRDATEEATLPS
ncbi:indoleamine 2,3-dioxygenase 2-like isoform X2 [Varanus komodoensis]|uniref:indoleamine 2,3-dioxygenase 2-like isoform X2 n=1 Tax=Varanus komodoensis TaxID=61221 RepID=UPI001CF76A35|nr:indoleamine 2,3-dioxygenase 2-like isoform X2 [Varanus komodoensis]